MVLIFYLSLRSNDENERYENENDVCVVGLFVHY
jgi:hypothetical protein